MRRTSPFADEVVEEGALKIDEGVVETKVSLDPPFVLKFDVAERFWLMFQQKQMFKKPCLLL